jgi:hypothetical protein
VNSAGPSPDQLAELFDRKAGIGDDAPKRPFTNLLVVRNHRARIRIVPAKDHVAASLAPENEASLLQSFANIAPRQTGWQPGHG